MVVHRCTAIWVTTSRTDREYLHQLATSKGLTVSVLIRGALNAYLKAESLRPLEPIAPRGRPGDIKKAMVG